MFNKNKTAKIIFEFEDTEGGINIKVKSEGKIKNIYVYGLQKYIDEKVEESKHDKNTGK